MNCETFLAYFIASIMIVLFVFVFSFGFVKSKCCDAVVLILLFAVIVSLLVLGKIAKAVPEITVENVTELKSTTLLDRQNHLTYINENNEEVTVYIDEIKYNSNKTYIEKQNKKWGFLYKTDYILHIKK